MNTPSPQGELDELEREEFFRLKKVQANKKKHAEAAAAQDQADAAADEAALNVDAQLAGAPGNVLAMQDEDVIF